MKRLVPSPGRLHRGASAEERITIPAVASIVGASPFFSDVRVFNTSYARPIEVTATYRCFIGGCPATAAQETFTLAPRESGLSTT